jgi:hypothetical protein
VNSKEAALAEPSIPRTTPDVLWEEFRALRPGTAASGNTLEAYEAAAEKAQLSALCLSGGGIRSAAFALGVVQALAGKGLLSSFDYVSSVSGGGYLNSFLQRWIVAASKRRNEAGVAEALRATVKGPEASEITRLREGSNFITPRVGAMSVDTWTAIATAVRNVMVNWTLFLPLFLIVTGVPQIVYWFLFPLPGWGAPFGLALQFLGLTIAMTTVARSLPSYRKGDEPSARMIWWATVPPVLVAAVGAMMVLSAPAWRGWAEEERFLPCAIIFVGATTAAYIFVILWSFFTDKIRRAQLIKDFPRWLLGSIAGAAVMYLAAKPLARIVTLTDVGVDNLEWLVGFGPAAFIASILVAGWLFSAIRSIRLPLGYTPDLDREWLVRMSAILMKPAVVWVILVFLTLIALMFLTGGDDVDNPHSRTLELTRLFAAGGALSGVVAAFAGNSGATLMGYVRKWLSLETVIAIAVLAFAFLALLAGGFLESWLAVELSYLICGEHEANCSPETVPWAVLFGHVSVVVALVVWVVSLGYVFDVNRFSLNGFYRNRLGRTFLGAARCDVRRPDPLTGFDARDNIRMHSLWPRAANGSGADGARVAGGGRRCLFPVINLALNVSATARLAWQERKAEPFVVTPFVCGSGMLDANLCPDPRGAYMPSENYGGSESDRGLEDNGMTLAGAMSISGAAVSPSMGYHSSAATAFLMTLFNLRLGAWLPNPVKWKARGDEDPTTRKKNALMPFLRELSGRTDDKTPEIYLSDGGHFENLGLYEMIRRRCSFIFVSDGGCDPAFDFTDLGNAIRKISIDLRTDIVFEDVKLGSKTSQIAGKLAYATATIRYPATSNQPDGSQGTLIYLKPSIIEHLPMDVNAYSIANAAFPHESTADQWYSESQFESYRRLGQFLTEGLGAREYLVPPEGPARMEKFFDDVSAAPAQSPAAAAAAAAAAIAPAAATTIAARKGKPDKP